MLCDKIAFLSFFLRCLNGILMDFVYEACRKYVKKKPNLNNVPEQALLKCY